MTTPIFPSIVPYGFPARRSALWKTDVQTAVSGKETRISRWSYPKWSWELPVECLRALSGQPAELQALVTLFQSCQGQGLPFLFSDPDDNQAAGQALGTGNGTTTRFQIVRAFLGLGGFVEPIFAPNTVSAVYLNGVVQSGGAYSVGAFGSASPGIITFATAPGPGVMVTADFSFYFPCRFAADQVDLDRILAGVYAVKTISFQSLK